VRSLTATLLAAQKGASAAPHIKLTACNESGGVVRYDWERLYTGDEPDYYHALAVPGDGSLVRARLTPSGDSLKLYRQRVASPGPGSDFSQWVYTGQYNVLAVAAAALGAEVSIFWIKYNREIRRIVSTDYGASWGSPELIDYTPTTAVYGLAAAYKSNGDLAIFFADQAVLYVQKYISGQWQAKAGWGKTTGDLSGVATAYDGDWNLLVTGQDASGNYKLWSLVCGDGGEVPAGTWSALRELASAPSGGDFEYRQPFLDKTDACRGFFSEIFTGTEAYTRPFWTHALPGSAFSDGLWREPVPFDLSQEYGLAVAHHGDYAWLTCPSGVWRADMTARSLELAGDCLAIRQELGETSGTLTAELGNDDGCYAQPGEGELADLVPGCRLDFRPGYRTTEGDEYSEGLSFYLESCEHTSAGGAASLILHAGDGWGVLASWRARYQLRWNKGSGDTCVRDILAFILARVGITLTVISQSAAATGFCPEFTISAGNDGASVVRRLLSFVPDGIFIEGDTAYLVNPLADDETVYSYGTDHAIREGRYGGGALAVNRVQVEGYDEGEDALILAEAFSWGEIGRLHDRLLQVGDRNIATTAEAAARGQARLRQEEIEAGGGAIVVPVNCGQQLYDVVAITDSRAGLDGAKRRVLSITTVYRPRWGEYLQHIRLGAV
jgi:hypothetical protein